MQPIKRSIFVSLLLSTALLGGACSDDSGSSKPEAGVADQKVADQKVADQKVADQKVTDQKVADQKVTDQKVADQKVTDQQAADTQVAVDLFRSDAGSCSEIGATKCFSNLACAANERCQSLDGAGVVVCCITGPRGTKQAGDPCSSESDCASAVCIAKGSGPSVCSKDCQSAADCPTGMKDCKTVAFSGSPHKWCFPQ